MSELGGSFKMDVELPAPEGLPESTTGVPYSILVVSNLAGSKDGSISGPLQSRVVAVTPDTFDAVMAEAYPAVSFTIADPTLPGSVMAEVSLRFDSIRAFHPKSVVEQLPATRSLAAVRARIVERMRGKLSAQRLSQVVAQAASADPNLAWLVEAIRWSPAPPSATEATAVDGLLGQIDFGDGESAPPGPTPKSPIGAMVAAAVTGGASLPAEEASAMRHTLAEIDKRTSAWLTAVLHAPQMQAVESAWRSLAFLVAHTDFRKGVTISLLHARRDELIDRLTALLIDPVFDEGAAAPDLIVVDVAFGNTAPDIEALDVLAQNAASLPALALAGASAEFFGVKHAWQMPTLPNIVAMFDQWQFAKWKTLRGQPYARMLGVIFGRCLLRTTYGHEEAKDLEYDYREECLSDQDLVWANGVIAAACAAAASVAQSGWPTRLSGFVHGRVEGFASCQGGKKGDKKFGPTDTLMPQPKIEELVAGGLNAAVGVRDHNDAMIWNGLTVARPARMDATALLEVSLPYQLFAARLSVLLLMLRPRLKGLSNDEVVALVTGHLCEWLGIQGAPTSQQFQVQVGLPDEGPAVPQLAVSVNPPPGILPGGIPVVLGYRLG